LLGLVMALIGIRGLRGLADRMDDLWCFLGAPLFFDRWPGMFGGRPREVADAVAQTHDASRRPGTMSPEVSRG